MHGHTWPLAVFMPTGWRWFIPSTRFLGINSSIVSASEHLRTTMCITPFSSTIMVTCSLGLIEFGEPTDIPVNSRPSNSTKGFKIMLWSTIEFYAVGRNEKGFGNLFHNYVSKCNWYPRLQKPSRPWKGCYVTTPNHKFSNSSKYRKKWKF